MGTFFSREQDFKFATATIKGNCIEVTWNKLKEVEQYNIEICCNEDEDHKRTEIACKNWFRIRTEPGRKFNFKISPRVYDSGETQDQRYVKSNTVYTVPSQVSGIFITETNGLTVEWTQPHGEKVKIFILVKISQDSVFDSVEDDNSTRHKWDYGKLIPGKTYFFRVWSSNESGEGKATTKSHQYVGKLEVSCWIYLKKDCVRVLHAVTGSSDASDITRKWEVKHYKKLELMPETYSLTRAESEATTAIDPDLKAKIFPGDNMITHDKLWDRGCCTEKYLLKGKEGTEHKLAYTISCQGKSIKKIPFKWICLQQPRSMATPSLQQSRSNTSLRSVDSGFPDATDYTRHDSDSSDTDGSILESLPEHHNVLTEENVSGRSSDLKDSPAPAGAASNPPQPTPDPVQNGVKTPFAQPETPGQVYNNYLQVTNAEHVHVNANNPNVGGKHETNHTPPQHQDTFESMSMPITRDYFHQQFPSSGGPLEDLSYLGAYGGGPAPTLFNRENGIAVQLKALQKKAASDTGNCQVPDTENQPASRPKSSPTPRPRASFSREARKVARDTFKKMPK